MKINSIYNKNFQKEQISNNLDLSIFRNYDIRGKYPKEVNEKVAYLIGQAFICFLKKQKTTKFCVKKNNLNIAVGQDNRLSSPSLAKALIKGIIKQGANVIDIGLSTTPMLYFSVGYYNFDGGIMITSSHNPSIWNGFKLVKEKAISISIETGIADIRNLVLQNKWETKIKKGKIIKITRKNFLNDYICFQSKLLALGKTKLDQFKIAVDTGNGVAGIIIKPLFKKMGLKFSPLFLKLDGNFPNRSPDPLAKGSLKNLAQLVRKEKLDFGIAFDGDGDRIVFVDHLGKVISADLITALMAKILLQNHSKKKIIYDVCSSRVIKETIEKYGGEPIIYKVGHSLIKEKMRKENIIFSGELSGHYSLKQSYFNEAPFFVLFKILEMMKNEKKTLKKLIQPFKKYYHSGEINFKLEFFKKKSLQPNELENYSIEIIKYLKKYYKNGKILEIDGLKIDYPNWWFNLRLSRTSPILKLVIEAKTKELMEKKKKELIKLIKTKLNKI